MTRHNELKGDPTEYNPDKGESGDESVENVPMPGTDDSPQGRYVLDSTDCDWDDDALWFDCPYCGDRLCSAWFFQSDSSCGNCGAVVDVKIEVRK